VHKNVRSHRRDLVATYGLDSTSKVALMFAFCKVDHHCTYFSISLFCFHLMHLKVMDPQTSFCGPLGVHGSSVGNRLNKSFVMFEMSHCLQYKDILLSIVLSQQCCKLYFISLVVAKVLWDLTTKSYRNRPLLTLLAGSAPEMRSLHDMRDANIFFCKNHRLPQQSNGNKDQQKIGTLTSK